MLGFVCLPDRGGSDRLLARVADVLLAGGVSLGGVVQLNTEVDPSQPCLMDLRVLPGGVAFRISQSLGRHSFGCRLDAAGLEEAVGQVGAALTAMPPQLLIVNKFGKQEAEGRGFRPLIGQALTLGVPVLTSVSDKNRNAFDLFAADFATLLPMDEAKVLSWCRARIGLLTDR